MIVRLKRYLVARFRDVGEASVPARIPEWAERAGMPPPQENEGFDEYVERVGLDPQQFVRKGEHSRYLANMRLTAYLMRRFPSYFEKHMEAKRKTRWHPPDA